MKQTQKILAFLLAVMIVISLAACGSKPMAPRTEVQPGTMQEAEEETEAAEEAETGAVKLQHVTVEPQELYSSDKMRVSLEYISCGDDAYHVVCQVENKTSQPVRVEFLDRAANGVALSYPLVIPMVFEGDELAAGESKKFGLRVTAEALSLIKDDVLREASVEFCLMDPEVRNPEETIDRSGLLTVRTSAYDASAELQVDGLVLRDRNGVKLVLDRRFMYQRDEGEEPYDVVGMLFINDTDYSVSVRPSMLAMDGVSFEVSGYGVTMPPHMPAYYLLTGRREEKSGLAALTDTGSFAVLECKLSIDAKDEEGNRVFYDWKYLYHSLHEDGTPYAAKTPHESGTPMIDDKEVYNKDGIVVTANYFGTPVHNNRDNVYGELKMTVVNDSDQDIRIKARKLDGKDVERGTTVCGENSNYEGVLVPAHNFEDVYVFCEDYFMEQAQLSTFSTMDVSISSDSTEDVFTIEFEKE